MTYSNDEILDTKEIPTENFDEEDTQKDMYLTFNLADESYAVEIRYVTEIIGMQKITHLPDVPDYLKGVVNLRDKVIPVVDMRLRFRMPEKEYGDRTSIIVTNIDNTQIGLVVDIVSEVMIIPEENVDMPPNAGRARNGNYIKGMGKAGDQVKIILDTEKLFSAEELTDINSDTL
jgi:purine-binding chemotaxis protein CheW